MMCRHPFTKDPSGAGLILAEDPTIGVLFPCGQCLPCRINRRRVWTLRIMFESLAYDESSFVTLTYSDDSLPFSYPTYSPSLCKRDIQLFIKRLRFHYKRKVRYYVCGEYGPSTFRPHYHGIFFGVSPFTLHPDWMSCATSTIHNPSLLFRLWSHGQVSVGNCEKNSAQYVAGYVTKKFITRHDDRPREFSLMSLKPGIGAYALESLTAALGAVDPLRFGGSVRFDGHLYPLGRYLFQRLAEKLELPERIENVVKDLRGDFFEYKKSRSTLDFLSWCVQKDSQAFLNLESRFKIKTGGIL